MKPINILLSAVGRRAYLVEYFKAAVRDGGGKVYVVNCLPDATGLLAADAFEIVPPSADSGYVEKMLDLCRRWNVALLFSLHDWDAPVIARHRERFLEIGTIPVMGRADLLATCLDKYATVEAVKKLDVCVPWTTLSLDEALGWQERNGRTLIVKPRWGQGSIGLFKVSTPSELTWAFNLSAVTAARFAAACPEINAKEPQVIVQECIGGVEYGCDIVNDLEGRYRRSFVKRKFGMRAGETDAAESVEQPAVVAAAEKSGRWSGHLGCMDSDWIVGDDGVPRLIELNPRFGGGYPFTHAAGANVVRACVDWANGIDDYGWCADFKIGVKAFKEIGIHVCDADDNPQA